MYFERFESVGSGNQLIGWIEEEVDGGFSVTLTETSEHLVDYWGENGGHSETIEHARSTHLAPTLAAARAVALAYVGKNFNYRTAYGIVPPPADLPR
jgi:hypothetical protein